MPVAPLLSGRRCLKVTKGNAEHAREPVGLARGMRGQVFNKALAMQKTLYEHGEKKLGYAGLCKSLTEWWFRAISAPRV